MISRQAKAKPALAKPKPQSEKQSEISKARLLILTWLEAKEAIPIASGEGNCELFDEGYSRNSGYEISITKTRPHPTNNSKVIVDTLWTLPRTLEVESLFINKLAELLLPELDKIAARVGIDDLSNLRDQIENELYESALDKQYEEEYERIFSRWLDRTKDMPTNMSNVASQYNPKRERVKTRKRSV